MAASLAEAARDRRRGQSRRPHPRRGAEPPLHRRRPPHARRHRLAALIGELTALHADFFIGAHFGGFREADGQCPAARHGDPHARRRPLHVRQAIRARSIASKPIRAARGTPMAPPPTPSSNSPTTSSSPIAAPGSPRAPPPAGRAPGASSAPRAPALGRRRPFRGARALPATRLPPRRSPIVDLPRPPTSAETHGHASVIAELPRRGRDRHAARNRRPRQYQEPRHGVRRHRERPHQNPRRQFQPEGHLRDQPRQSHPHRHHDQGHRGPGRRGDRRDRRHGL